MMSGIRKSIKGLIVHGWRSYRESKVIGCKDCMGWGEVGHGSENRECWCEDGLIHGDSWGMALDSLVERILCSVGIHEDEAW